MSVEALEAALNALDERTWCEGTYRASERIALALPDGDVGAVDDPRFVDWLLEHAEVAPFGHGGVTRVDPEVRNARRLVGRSAIQVAGFEPAAVLAEIEQALSPRTHLEARLTDVLVYPAGGHFAPHKDTPRSPDLVGTLIVGLPVAHTGGAFSVDDGTGPHEFDWSTEPDRRPDLGQLRWVAVFGDVDHEVKSVTSGARVTLVYALVQTDRERRDPAWTARMATLRAAAERLELPSDPLMIVCTRHVIIDDPKQVKPIAALRGSDRDVADVLVEAGFNVVVRACIAASDPQEVATRFPSDIEWTGARLVRPLPSKLRDVVTYDPEPSSDDGEIPEQHISILAPYLAPSTTRPTWLVRQTASATAIHQALFSANGYFGNEAYDAFLYSLAALEVTRKVWN